MIGRVSRCGRATVAAAVLLAGVCGALADAGALTYLNMELYDGSSGTLVGAAGPLFWSDQAWLVSGVPVDTLLTLRVSGTDATGRPLVEGLLPGVWVDSFYSMFGDGMLMLMAEPDGIRVLAYPFMDLGLVVLTPVQSSIAVAVDIRPGEGSNMLNVRSRGNLPAAILGGDGVNVLDIDAATLTLGGITPERCLVSDVTGPEGVPDGIDDLLLFISIPDLMGALGTVSDGQSFDLVLQGNTLDGTAIEGADSVSIQNKGKNR